MEEARVAALQAMPIFGGLRADVLEALLAASATVRVAPGDYFFRERDRAVSMFVLERGAVELLKAWQGVEHVIGSLAAGDCFGEMALIDLFPRSASVRATEPCTAIELSTESFFRLFETDLEQFALVQTNIARELSRRLRAADEQLFRTRFGAPEFAPQLALLMV